MFSLVPFRSGGIGRRRDSWDMDNIFENFFKDSMFPAFYANNSQMKVDIQENPQEFVIEAEIPGVMKEEINLEIDDNRLTISVNKKDEINEEKENYIRRERRTSSMVRTFAVENILPDKVSAKYENGVLTIILPKKVETAPKYKKVKIE